MIRHEHVLISSIALIEIAKLGAEITEAKIEGVILPLKTKTFWEDYFKTAIIKVEVEGQRGRPRTEADTDRAEGCLSPVRFLRICRRIGRGHQFEWYDHALCHTLHRLMTLEPRSVFFLDPPLTEKKVDRWYRKMVQFEGILAEEMERGTQKERMEKFSIWMGATTNFNWLRSRRS